MGKHFIDFENDDFCFFVSDNIVMDLDGNTMMRLGDNMLMDMNSGDLHMTSLWGRDDNDTFLGGGADFWNDNDD